MQFVFGKPEYDYNWKKKTKLLAGIGRGIFFLTKKIIDFPWSNLNDYAIFYLKKKNTFKFKFFFCQQIKGQFLIKIN